jgi:hypothetical protein
MTLEAPTGFAAILQREVTTLHASSLRHQLQNDLMEYVWDLHYYNYFNWIYVLCIFLFALRNVMYCNFYTQIFIAMKASNFI